MPERQVITSLSGTVAPLLTVNTCDAKAIDRHSIWVPRIWKKATPFVIDDNTLTPNNQQGLNLEMVYDIPKMAHLIKSLCLHVTFPPHTVVPAGTANLVDHLGYAMHDYFRIHFGSNLCYEVLPHDLYFKYRKLYGIEHRDAINDLIGGDLTLAQRTADLANGREYFINLMLPFEEHQSKALPLLTLSQKLRLVHRTRSLANLTNVAAGTTVTPTAGYGFEIIMEMVHLTGDEANMILDMSQDDNGIAYMIHQHVRQNSDDFASTVNGAINNVRLTAFTKPMKTIYFAYIPTRLINDTGFNDIFFFKATPTLGPVPPGMNAYNPLVSYQIVANGQIIQRSIPAVYDTIYRHYRYVETQHGEDIFNQFYNQFPNSFNASIGYLDYTNFNNPVFTGVFGTGGTGVDPINPLVAQSLRFVANGQDYNFWYFQNGNMTRTFN